MSKSSRIAALDEKIEGLHAHLASLAAEHDGEIAMLRAHCGIPRPDAPPADPAPVALTADDAAWLREGDALLLGNACPCTFHRVKADGNFVGQVETDRYLHPATGYRLPPATAALIAQRKASATLAVGDTVEVTGMSSHGVNRRGQTGEVDRIGAGGRAVSVRFGGTISLYPASSLRRVQPAARVPSPTCGTCHGRWNHCPDCTPAEQPDPAAQSMAQRILAILDEGYHEYDEMEHALRAAAAVPPVARPGDVESYAYDIGYNAGQSSILAPMLAALKGDTHEQR